MQLTPPPLHRAWQVARLFFLPSSTSTPSSCYRRIWTVLDGLASLSAPVRTSAKPLKSAVLWRFQQLCTGSHRCRLSFFAILYQCTTPTLSPHLDRPGRSSAAVDVDGQQQQQHCCSAAAALLLSSSRMHRPGQQDGQQDGQHRAAALHRAGCIEQDAAGWQAAGWPAALHRAGRLHSDLAGSNRMQQDAAAAAGCSASPWPAATVCSRMPAASSSSSASPWPAGM